MIFGWIHLEVVNIYLQEFLRNQTACNVMLGILVILILLAVKGIFFTTDTKKDKDKNVENGILIENENGKLLISKDTIQNLVSGVAQGFENTKEVTSKVILTKDNQINIDVTLFVEEEAIIKELSNKLQLKIKEIIKQSIDIDIQQVNIKVKNIAPKPQKIEE